MENSAGAPTLTWIFSGIAAIAALLGIPLTHFLSRRQSGAQIHKTESEGREIDSRIINEAHESLVEYGELVQNLRIEKAWDKSEIMRLNWELSLSAGRERVLNESIRQAHAELEMLRKPRLGSSPQ